MNVHLRQLVERKIALRLLNSLFAAGFTVKVDDGGEELGPFTNTKDAIKALFSVDQEHIIVYGNEHRIGWIFLVYGNDGWDVVSDYTTNMESIMGPVNELAEKLCIKFC